MAPRRAAEAAPGAPGPLLSELSASVLEAWPADAQGSRAAVREEFERLIAWVEAAHDGRPPPEETGGDRLLQRRLLEALRLACLRRWSDDSGGGSPDPTSCLDLLAALERRARATLPRDARDFASRLTDPDGFELLVEMAHDLRSPLTSVSFLAETLRGGFSGDVNDQQRHQLGLIYSAALAMQSVVTDVMDLARLGGDLLDEDPSAFSIGEVFDGVRRLVAPIAEIKHVELRTVVPDPDRAWGRPLALRRVLLNLVTNGLKFTEQGWVEMSATRVEREAVEIAVRDTGRGIDPDNQRTMFDPFRKARDRSGSFFSGSGLGLAIVRRLVQAMDSELAFETRPDWGTRFHFRLHLPAVAPF